MRIFLVIGAMLLLAACGSRKPLSTEAPPPPEPSGGVTPSPHEPEARPPAAPARTETVPPNPVIEKAPPRDMATAIAEVNGRLGDVYFAYDRAELSEEALAALRADAKLLGQILAEFPGIRVTVEGHCDERGSAEYNLALGDRRASRAVQGLRELNLAVNKFHTISFGKEKPQCAEPNESCWRKNRRAHFVVEQAQ